MRLISRQVDLTSAVQLEVSSNGKSNGQDAGAKKDSTLCKTDTKHP